MRTDEGDVIDALRRARPQDPYIRWRADPAQDADVVMDGDHVAWTGKTRRGERWATAMGEDPDRLTALLESLDAVAPIDGITGPESLLGALPSRFTGPDPGHWCLWRLGEPLELDAGSAVELPGDDPRIRPLLEHSSSAYIFPGHPRLVRWTGVEESGVLLGVAAQLDDAHGAAHLVSVCTAPTARGRGLARQAMSLLIERALDDGVPAVILEMYVDNPAGARLYGSLGFDEVGRYHSWLIGTGGEPPLMDLLDA